MLHVAPVVVIDDDISVRKSFELLIGGEDWPPDAFPSAHTFLDTNNFLSRAVSFLTFLFEAR
jgi:FixJ family two-component response regulator